MADLRSFHEDLSRETETKAGSERALGFTFAGVFLLIGLAPLIGGGAIRPWALIAAGTFALLGGIAPKLLKPLNWLWFRIGLILHKVVNPVIMALLFFTTVMPIAIIMRILGKDPLHLKLDPKAESYWIERTPPGLDPETMRHQF